jgi:hypothetical protein
VTFQLVAQCLRLLGIQTTRRDLMLIFTHRVAPDPESLLYVATLNIGVRRVGIEWQCPVAYRESQDYATLRAMLDTAAARLLIQSALQLCLDFPF